MTGITEVSIQPGEDPSTGLPTPIAIPKGESKRVHEITAKKGWLNFIMIVLNKSKAKLIIGIDGDTKINVTPLRLFTLGTTAPNSYVWVGKYDETNNEYGVEVKRRIHFNENVRIIVEAPSDEAVNIIDYNIFWEEET